MEVCGELLRQGSPSRALPSGAGPLDEVIRDLERASPVAVPEGARRGASNRLLPDGERFEVVDRRPQISRGPLDDHLDDVRGDIDPLLGGNGPKYVFHCVIVNSLKFDGLA